MSDERRRDEEAIRRDDTQERQADALVRLVSDRAFNELDPSDPHNMPFFAWLARELRDQQTAEEREVSERTARVRARHALKRWAEENLRMRDEDGEPDVYPAPAAVRTGAALDLATVKASAPHANLAVAAGEGRELWDEECVEWVRLPDDLPPGRHLALRVSGDSMMPFLHEGDTLLVRVGMPPSPGSVVVARRADDGYVVKRVARLRRESVELVSLNPAFAPIMVPRDERSILGQVVLRWCSHRSGGT